MVTNIIFTAIVLLFPILGLIFGLGRGLKRQTFRILTVLISVIAAFCFAPKIASATLNVKTEKIASVIPYKPLSEFDGTLGEYMVQSLKSNETIASMLEVSPSLETVISAIPKAIISVLSFVILFFIIKLALWFVFFIISVIFLRTRSGKSKHLLAGGIIGFLQGVICSFVVIVPIVGMLGFVGDSIETLKSDSYKDVAGVQTIVELDDKYLSDLRGSATMNILEKLKINTAAQKIFDKLTTVKIGAGDDAKEVPIFTDISDNILPSLAQMMKIQGIDFSSLTAENISDLKELSKTLSDSGTASVITAEIISNASKDILDGKSFLGIDMSKALDESSGVSEPVKQFFTELSDINSDNVGDKLDTTIEVIELFDEYHMFEKIGTTPDGATEPLGFPDLFEDLVKQNEFNDKLTALLEDTSFSEMQSLIAAYKTA